jgi:CheY-like chemotaxis protein
MADPTQIHQVLINLCINAAHAMREGEGVLEVNLADMELGAEDAARFPDLKPGSYVRLTVSDTGHGMDRSVIERIFDPFFTTKQRGKGTGMGLAVVHGIVKSCGGAITVDSEPEKGSTFHVLFPSTKTEAPPQTRPAEPLPTGKERILLVDDEEVVVESLQMLLKRCGYEVVARMDGLGALEVFRAEPDKFDVVLTDQTMPHMAGKELAQELIRIRPDIPIILFTGFSEQITEEEARAIGIREYAMKPFVMYDMARTIRKVLDEDGKHPDH